MSKYFDGDKLSGYEDSPTTYIFNEKDKQIAELKQQGEELKGKRLEFYNDDVRQTQVINGVHFDIEQLLVFSEYVEHEKYIIADKEKKINQLKQQLHDLPKKIVGEIKKELYSCGKTYLEDEPYIEICIVQGILDTILKKYGE